MAYLTPNQTLTNKKKNERGKVRKKILINRTSYLTKCRVCGADGDGKRGRGGVRGGGGQGKQARVIVE